MPDFRRAGVKERGKGVATRRDLEEAESTSAERVSTVTKKPSIRKWLVLYKSRDYSQKALCLTTGESHVP